MHFLAIVTLFASFVCELVRGVRDPLESDGLATALHHYFGPCRSQGPTAGPDDTIGRRLCETGRKDA